MLYAANIAKLSQKFCWPSWVIYENSFRQEAAEAGHTDWTRIDASRHAQCFHGMALSSESWCSLCHSVDHLKNSCSVKPQDLQPTKRPAPPQIAAGGQRALEKPPPQYVATMLRTMETAPLRPDAIIGTCAGGAMGPTLSPNAAKLQLRSQPLRWLSPDMLFRLCC